MIENHLNKYHLAKRWSLTPRTIDRWRAEGLGPHYLKIGGRILYRLEDVIVYENNHVRDGAIKHAGIPLTPAEQAQMTGGAS